MPTRADVFLYQNNDEVIELSITDADTDQAQDLTGAQIDVYLKESYRTEDAEATVLSTTTGEVTVTSASGGLCTVEVPASALATAGNRWWRADVTSGGTTRTACYGELKVVDL